METEKITSSYRKSVGSAQALVDVVLQREDENSISKVLSNTARAYVDEIEILNGEAHYSGGVVFDCLYVDEQGTSHTIVGNADLNGKIEEPSLNPLMKPIYSVEVVEVKVDSLDDERVKLSGVIEIKMDVVATEEFDEVKVGDDNIQLLKETVKQFNVVSSGTKTFCLNEEFEVKSKINKILLSNAQAFLKSTSSGTGYFTVEGEMFLNALLQVETDEGTALKNLMETVNFKEELEDELIQKDDMVYAFIYIRPQDLSVTIAGDSQTENPTNAVSVNATITVKYVALRETENEIYVDAFSRTNKTNIVTESFDVAKNVKSENFSATIEGQTIIGEEEARIAKVVGVANEHISVANSNVTENELTVEGIAYASVIYMTDDDTPTLSSVELEIPFSNKFDVQDMSNGGIFVVASVKDIDVKAKKGKEINATLDVNFAVDTYQTDTNVLIKDIELTEELVPADYSLQIYIAPEGSTLWDVAKHLLVSEDVLMAQNPDLVFPLEQSQSVVYFNQRTK